ncbi:eukaryotic translation initiation factor 2B delta subunit [Phlebopus sp. FC_14]|nr:eukaryotic translation initiation factor 2B delta subunit [Phlebopus sp. FC_14]
MQAHSSPQIKASPVKSQANPPSSTNANALANAQTNLNGPRSQKHMTKAERREQQEAQRAAKAAAKAASGQPSAIFQGISTKNPPSASGSNKGVAQLPAATPKKPGKGADGKALKGEHKDNHLSHPHPMPDETPRGVRIFSHFGTPKPPGVTKGDVHPAIIRLGLQFSEFKITGANARCIAMLSAFKTVIQDYVTPPSTTLSRHLMAHLSPQITYLVSARPLSVTMGNAIRQLKLEISGSDIDLPEQDAKDALCDTIDNYIRDRILLADQVIQETAGKKIKDGDVILTYARSSVVEKVLLNSWADGKQFSVVVVDSKPMLEGKSLLKSLTAASIPCTYLLLPSLPSVLPHITTLFVGAHSLHANGAVFSRAGTAMVAMMAKTRNVPVVVCCETYKWAEGVRWDGVSKNELAPNPFPPSPTSSLASSHHSVQLKQNSNLTILNPLYDLTPPSCITAVVTEVGVIPPSSISSIPGALGRGMVGI